MSLKSSAQELVMTILNDVDHGECFYDEEMFEELIDTVDTFKKVAKKVYDENQEDMG